MLQRERDHIGQTVRRVEVRPRPRFDTAPTPYDGARGTDFGTPIVPKTTITAATRVVSGSSVTFTPGSGEAWLFRHDTSGDLEVWKDSDNNPISKTVTNLSFETFEPNPNNETSATPFSFMDGTAFEWMDGTAFDFMPATGGTNYIGESTAILKATMDRQGKLTIPHSQQQLQTPTVQVQRAVVVESGGINPDSVGLIQVFIDQQLDDFAQGPGSGSSQIQLAAAGTSSADDFYNGWMIQLISGPGAGQVRFISDYTGVSRTASIQAFDVGLSTPNPWRSSELPASTTVYKLYRPTIVNGHWSHAEALRKLRRYEEVHVQRLGFDPSQYEILRGTDKSLMRGNTREIFLDGTDNGEVEMVDTAIDVFAKWDFATANKNICWPAGVAVAWDDVVPGFSKHESNVYRIWGVDCSELVDSPSFCE